MRVLGVKPRNKGSMVRVQEDPANDSPILEVWCSADQETVQGWAGTPPPDYELRTKRDSTERVLVEKRGQGQSSYRNTKEAFDAEAKSRKAWQLEEEDRKDRRTALMTAAEALESSSWLAIGPLASDMYRWLRSPAEPVSDTDGGRAESGEGQGASSAAAPSPDRPTLDCDHLFGSGREARVVKHGTEVCAKCGVPWVSIVEGTTADLGPAKTSEEER